MTARRALVVDDSRSARAFLTRVLERYDLKVDGAESAEEAIEYLTHQRPDVIFMDHLMPGMDGFQAVQAIKNNPRTATIPIMMYTSQEGELYLSQARALGAIGVLPKQIKHTDVSKALNQLKLLDEPEVGDMVPVKGPVAPTDAEPPPDTTVERRSPARPKLPPLPPDLRAILDAMLSHHARELHRFVVDSLESQADRVVGDVRLLLHERAEGSTAGGRRRMSWGLGLGLAALLLALLAAVLFGLQWQRLQRSNATLLAAQLSGTQQLLSDTRRNLQLLQAADAAAAASAAAPTNEAGTDAGNPVQSTSIIELVPFGETPLAGARLERVSGLLSRLNAEDFRGVVQIRSIPGRFCMVTGPNGTPALAADATLYSKCEGVGNPRDDNGSAGQRQSVGFANMISLARESARGKYEIQINAGSPDEVLTPYPPISDTLAAGEWNHVAAENNRVEVHWQAAH